MPSKTKQILKKSYPIIIGDKMPDIKKVIRNFKLTPEENKRLKRDAYAHGMNVSEYIRFLIKKEHKENAEE